MLVIRLLLKLTLMTMKLSVNLQSVYLVLFWISFTGKVWFFFQLFASPSQLYRLFCSRNFIFFRLRLNLYKILKPFTLRCKKLNLVSTLYPGEVRSLEEKRKRARESLSKVIANNTVSFFPDVLVTDDPRLSHLPRDGMENWKERKLDEIFRRWPNRCWMDIFTVTQGRDFSLM